MAGDGFPYLSEDELDAITELFNVGMGSSAAALSDMLGEEVILSIPASTVSSRARISRELTPGADRVCAVRGAFTGPFTGEAMLVLPENGALGLVSRLVPVESETGEPGEIEQDALTEIGNILLNGCLASLSNLVGGEISGALPGYQSGRAESFIGLDETPVLSVRIEFALATGAGRGHALFLFDIASLDAFREAVRRTMANL